MRRHMPLALVTTILVSSPAAAQQHPAPVEGVYGDLHYIEETGDIVGTEIIVSRLGALYQVSYQEAEGVPGPIFTVPATVHGDSISFQLPPDTVTEVGGGTRRSVLHPHPPFQAIV